jgi:hypothetical protein
MIRFNCFIECTGNFFIDDEVLLREGKTEKDLEQYAVKPGVPLMPGSCSGEGSFS